MRCVGSGDDIRLLGAGRHAGRRPAALHVEDHRGDLGEIGEAEKLLHQRNAGAGSRGEGTRPIPRRADHDAERGKLVLGLDDGEAVLAGFRIDAVARAMARECFGKRGGRRDGVPGANRGAAVECAERRRRVALDIDAVADRVGALDLEADRAGEMLERVIAADMERLKVRRDQLVLALELLADQRLDFLDVDVEQSGERADINDVLEQLALAGVGVLTVADRSERHADHGDAVAEFRCGQGLGRIVEQVAARFDRGDVLVPGLRVHRHHEIDTAARAEMSGRGEAHLIPSRQALDVGREDVARRDRHAHAQHGAGKQLVGAR